jgi:hypothetical protein
LSAALSFVGSAASLTAVELDGALTYSRAVKLGEGLVCVCLVLASSACGSSVTDFEGVWVARHVEGDNSCIGEYESDDPGYKIRLRAGTDSDLEYVSYDFEDPTKVTCVQAFSVDGNVATIEDDQDCSFEYSSTDSVTGEIVTQTMRISFSEDRLEVDGDELEERGESRAVSADTDCSEAFRIEFELEE